MRQRVHGKRCSASKSHWKRCRCVCGGRDHGSDHKEPGLLRFVQGGTFQTDSPYATPVAPPKRKGKKK